MFCANKASLSACHLLGWYWAQQQSPLLPPLPSSVHHPQHGTMHLSLDLQIADYGRTVQFFLQDSSLVVLFLPTSVLSKLRAHCVAKPLGKEAVAVRKPGQDAFAKCIALTTAALFRHPPLLSFVRYPLPIPYLPLFQFIASYDAYFLEERVRFFTPAIIWHPIH